MIFKAEVSSKAHPEYGQATIPFPIPDNQYDSIIELLETMDKLRPQSHEQRRLLFIQCFTAGRVAFRQFDATVTTTDNFNGIDAHEC